LGEWINKKPQPEARAGKKYQSSLGLGSKCLAVKIPLFLLKNFD
jgi:hypothetical protein